MKELQTVTIAGAESPLMAVEVDGKPHVSLRHACDALGIDFASQTVKLRGKSWATVVMSTTVGSDGKSREMSMIDRRTMTMWLATIDENRVAENVRPTLVAYQAQAADALEAHFHGKSTLVNIEDVTKGYLAKLILEAEEEKAVIAAALESAAPAIAYHDRYVAKSDVVTVTNFAAGYGLSAQQAYELMKAKGLVYAIKFDRWSEKKKQVVSEHEWRFRSGSSHPRAQWFDLRPQHNAPRHHNGQVRQTLYIRVIHAPELAAFLGLSPEPQQLAINEQEVPA